MEFKGPEALSIEHEALHAELVQLTQAGGKVGAAAKAVASVLHPHFLKEEEYAVPPLGLLAPLARGGFTVDMKEVLAMTDRLKRDLDEMLKEHQAIVAAADRLREAAKAEGKFEAERFAESLKLHARVEEQVLYPAAILVGEYVKTRLRG